MAKAARLAIVLILAAGRPALAFEGLLPPERFDYVNPDVEILYFDRKTVTRTCGGHPGYQPASCAILEYPEPGRCTLIIPNADGFFFSKSFQAKIVRHEMAHCNGWSFRHER